MKVKLFNKKIKPACEYCFYTADKNQKNFMCAKKRALSPSSSCKKFVYDPLMRKPKVAPPLKEYSPKDFSLD